MDALDSRQIRAFVALAKHKSFTRAAEELRLTQSAVSHAIRALETELDCSLVQRLGKSVELTEAGEEFLKHALPLLDGMRLAREAVARTHDWGRGRLRLGASPAACQYILPPVLREFRECFPRAELAIEPGDTPRSVQLLHDGQLDLAIGLDPRPDLKLSFLPLFQDELIFVVHPLHPWAQAGRVAPAQLAGHPFIIYSKASLTFQMIEGHFRRHGVSLTSVIELGSVEAIKELVKIGLGASILAPWIARKELREGSLIAVPMLRGPLIRPWGILTRKARRLSLIEETFVGLCSAVAQNLADPA